MTVGKAGGGLLVGCGVWGGVGGGGGRGEGKRDVRRGL